MRCRDLRVLEEFVGGELPANREETIRQHLASCSRCRESVEDVSANLETLGTVREAMGSESGLPAEEKGPERIGDYRILGELGRGGMGTVYEAEDAGLKRRIAIKVLPRLMAQSPERRKRFEREAQLLAVINHPNIATIHSLEEHEGVPFLTMELIPGKTLAERTDRRPMTIEEAMAICRQVAHALTAAHREDVVHRDLKPHNILITDEGLVKILDFGLAVALAEESGDPGQESPPGRSRRLAGTPGYMSPEQVRGEPVDQRADIWAFGCVLFRCLTGKHAFDAPTLQERATTTLEAEPDWRLLPDETPIRIRRLLGQCLEKNPERRRASMAQVRASIEDEIALRSRPGVLRPRTRESRGNLPQSVSSFIGRKAAIADIRKLLSDHSLITLTGAGGCGKSRLALELSRGLESRFPDGVWHVGLAPISNPALVSQSVAEVLGVKEERGGDPASALGAYLSGRSLVLILDNCEHLLEACRALAGDLLATASGLRILATSREPLGVPGERIYPVSTLGLPPEREELSVSDVEAVESVQLFAERAAAVKPDFALSESNAPVVARICRRLDGLPLALELAAPKIRVLTVEEIDSRLTDRFRLLTGTSRSSLSRHQSMRALIDWSYDQLTLPEQRMLRSLAVFAGGWTLEAMEAVCSGDGIEEWEALDLVTSLVDKSLVEFDVENASAAGPSRFRMLETVREYARDRLVDAGDIENMRRRHRDFYLDLAEEASKQLTGREQKEWIARLNADYANLRTALETQDPDPQPALRLAAALGRYWGHRGNWTEGREILGRVLSLPGADAPTRARIVVLNWAGNLTAYQGEYGKARVFHEECLGLSRKLGDRWYEASALNNLGSIANYEKDYRGARSFHEQSLAIRRELEDPWAVALSLYHLAVISLKEKDLEGARPVLEECVREWEKVGDRVQVGVALTHLGHVARLQGDFDAARGYLEESLRIQQESGERWAVGLVLHHLGQLQKSRGELHRAAEDLRESLRIRREQGDRQALASSLEALGSLAVHWNLSLPAARLLGAAEALRERVNAPLPPIDQDEHDRDVQRLREQIDGGSLEEAWNEGKGLNAVDAVDLAMDVPDIHHRHSHAALSGKRDDTE